MLYRGMSGAPFQAYNLTLQPRTARPLISMASVCVARPLDIVLYRGMPGAPCRTPPTEGLITCDIMRCILSLARFHLC